jgi:predicted alpha/beta superfamily hydrolase
MKIILLTLLLLFSHFAESSVLILATVFIVDSHFLGEEIKLFVILPVDYDEQSKTYPVLYVLHGQWDMLSTVSTIDLMSNQLPGFVVVGVESKGLELRPEDNEITPFAKFLTQEVLGFVEKNYAVASYNILSGHSNSGRFVLDLWLNNTNDFTEYYAFSPSLDDGYLKNKIAVLSQDSFDKLSPLKMTIADEGEHMQMPFNEITETLKTNMQERFSFTRFPEQSHNTTKHHSMQYALELSFAAWVPSYETKVGGLNGLISHYKNLTQKYGFEVNVPIDTLQQLAAHYAISEKQSDVLNLKALVKFTLKQSADNSAALVEIADYLKNNGYEKAGENVFNEICKNVATVNYCAELN